MLKRLEKSNTIDFLFSDKKKINVDSVPSDYVGVEFYRPFDLVFKNILLNKGQFSANLKLL